MEKSTDQTLKTLKILLAAEQFKIEHGKGRILRHQKRVEEALADAIEELHAAREMFDAAVLISLFIPNPETVDRGWIADIHISKTHGVGYHVSGEPPGEAESIMEAWQRIKEQATASVLAEVKKPARCPRCKGEGSHGMPTHNGPCHPSE